LITEKSKSISAGETVFVMPLKTNTEGIISSINRDEGIKIEIVEIKTEYTPILHSKSEIADSKTGINTKIAIDCDLSKNFYSPEESRIEESRITTQEVPKNERNDQFPTRNGRKSKSFKLRRTLGNRLFISNETQFYRDNKKEVIENTKDVI
jgi:hypothetical protein